MRGEPSPSGPVPFTWSVARLAEQWGVPPWVLTDEPDTPEVRAAWVHRGLLFLRLMEG